MQITETKVKVSDLCKNYSDNGDGGVFGFDGMSKVGATEQAIRQYMDKMNKALKNVK